SNSNLESKYNELIFTGYVKDINMFLYGADFTIIPIEKGGGTNLKIFEALAVGLPIITSKYAIKNIESDKNSIILIADGNYEIKVDLMIKKLKNFHYQRNISNSYNWEDRVKNFLEFLSQK
ncbi:MAG: glycosyltransferase family 4 protein, partial [Candidatus Lokiarchaeota archaeon]